MNPVAGGDEGAGGEGDGADGERPPMDVTVEVEDAAGRRAAVSLRSYGPLRYPLETRILRRSDREEERFARLYELLPQTYTIPLEDFEAANPALDLWSLRTVRFVFDRTDAGTVVLDDVGFSRPGSAYTRVRVETARRPSGARYRQRTLSRWAPFRWASTPPNPW